VSSEPRGGMPAGGVRATRVGEVRVRARLTNAVDEALVRRGMLEPAQVRTYEADALVDTGAVRTVLPADVAARLGLGERGRRVAEYADGRHEAVSVTEPLVVELEKLDLFVDCHRRRLVANPAHPDQPVTKVK
jgi:predicted aspartyl protease